MDIVMLGWDSTKNANEKAIKKCAAFTDCVTK